MEVVLSAQHFASIGGAETYLLTVAEQLERLGHGVTVHAQELGEMADVARRRGVRVCGELDELPTACDSILVQDAVTTHLLAARYPQTPQVFVSHGLGYDWMLPPQLPGLVGKVVAMNERVRRRAEAAAADYEVVRLRQPIDLDRFSPRAPIRRTPRRVLLLGNYLRGSRRAALLEVCAELGLDCRQLGAHGAAAHAQPEIELADADIVVGYGRSALEGMACGRAVYVFDHSGGDGWVTGESYPRLEANGFAGSASDEAIDRARLRRDLRAYTPDMGLANRELARVNHDAIRCAADLVTVLQTAPRPVSYDEQPLREIARLQRLQWQVEGRAALLRVENEELRERLEDLQREQTRALDAEHNLLDKLERLKATRRYRAGVLLAGPLDAARRAADSELGQRLRAYRPRRRQRPRLLALVAYRDEERFLPGLLENLMPQVDGLIALDDGSCDGSTELLRDHPLVVEVLHVPPGAQAELEDGKNHRALVEASWRHRPDWLLGIDADERVERDFRARAEEEIARAEHGGHPGLWVPFRELWGAPNRMRVDGIWGGKRKACLFRADRRHRFDDRRVHANWAPWPPARGDYPAADLRLYHLRMITPADRRARLERYHRIDPDRVWQPIGYDYLLDEEGIELQELEPGRDYVPLGR
jgi:Glycosyl transferase family 2